MKDQNTGMPNNAKDLVARNYFKQDEPFADLFNVILYQGKQIIKPKQLKPLDITELAEKEITVMEKRRDVLKLLEVKTDGKQSYMILGLECQSRVEWKMAIRMMMYDAIRYDEQLRKKKKRKEMIPVISIVINLSGKRWIGPKSVKEIFKGVDPRVLDYISDYKMNVIDPLGLDEAEIMRFRSDLRILMILMKYSDNKEKMKTIIQDEKWMKEASREAVLFSNKYFGIELEEKKEREEKVEMKHALALVIEEEAEKRAQIIAEKKVQMMVEKKAQIIAEKRTRKIGKKIRQEIGEKERVKGREEVMLQAAKKMLEDGLEEEFIAKYIDLSASTIRELKQERN